jgi:hypothetical protein
LLLRLKIINGRQQEVGPARRLLGLVTAGRGQHNDASAAIISRTPLLDEPFSFERLNRNRGRRQRNGQLPSQVADPPARDKETQQNQYLALGGCEPLDFGFSPRPVSSRKSDLG